MSGAWAREADAQETWDPKAGLDRAALALTLAMCGGSIGGDAAWHLRIASAIIRRERRRLDPERKWKRHSDWSEHVPAEGLIWYALRAVAQASNAERLSASSGAWHLRDAESALRTLYARGLS